MSQANRATGYAEQRLSRAEEALRQIRYDIGIQSDDVLVKISKTVQAAPPARRTEVRKDMTKAKLLESLSDVEVENQSLRTCLAKKDEALKAAYSFLRLFDTPAWPNVKPVIDQVKAVIESTASDITSTKVVSESTSTAALQPQEGGGK